MSFVDNFKGKQYKEELDKLTKEYEEMKALMTPEMNNVITLRHEIEQLQNRQSEETAQIDELNKAIQSRKSELDETQKTIDEKKKYIIWLDDETLAQQCGLYKPQFAFATALQYKDEIAKLRNQEKEMIKKGLAVTGNQNWSVNNNQKQGQKMVSDTAKLLLRAFNSECDDLISKVTYTHYDTYLNRMYKSAEAISKLGTIMQISITNQYLELKVKELHLAYEYLEKKADEKEALKEARAEQREQEKAQRELEEQKKKVEKEQTHYQNAYETILAQLNKAPDDQDLLSKKAELEGHLSEIEKSLVDIDYRQNNMKAGYVYIISNIGAFGEGVYKIGMTRRLEPQDRVDELGDASVPFNFDVHAMIFSDDAPALEAALHRAFEDRKLNMVNQRREFFRVSLDEIKEVVKNNFDKTVEFIDIPEAEQYRMSMQMRK